MMDNAALSKKLQDIVEKQDLEALDNFLIAHPWSDLKDEEKFILGKLLIKKGESQLKSGDSRFHESFALAEQIAPKQPASIFFLKGQAYSSQTTNSRCLLSAIEAFEQSIALEPHFFEAYLLCGEALIHRGLLHQNPSFFQKAQLKFQEGSAFLKQQPQSVEAHFFWKWGVSWYFMGMTSGEPYDYYQALQKFRRAHELGQQGALFWRDFAEVLMELSELTRQLELCVEAAEFYHASVCENFENDEIWFSLASCQEKLYEGYGKMQHFELATAAFDVASGAKEPNFFLWLRWGKLNLNGAKLQKNHELISEAIEKFKKASEIFPDHPVLLGLWAECEILAGSQEDKLDLLRSAERKIKKSVKQIPRNPHIWALYGTCLNELGRYFAEEAYYIKAIEKFQEGLDINDQDPLLWFGLASTFYFLGECRSEAGPIEQAIECFSKVFDLGEDQLPQLWNDWALAYMKLAEFTHNKAHLETSIQKFEQMIQLIEKIDSTACDEECLYNYGCALDFLGDITEETVHYEKAILALNKALKINPYYAHARYNLAVTLSHLGEATSDIEILHQAVYHFQLIINLDFEDEMACNDCGLALLNIAELVHETTHPERSQAYYDEAEQKFMHALALGFNHAYYNLACLHSLTQNCVTAMHYLELAERSGTLPPLDDMLHDDWLENLVETAAFRLFISSISSRNSAEES